MTTDECGIPDPIIGWYECERMPGHDGDHEAHYRVYKVALDITEHYTLRWSLNAVDIGNNEKEQS